MPDDREDDGCEKPGAALGPTVSVHVLGPIELRIDGAVVALSRLQLRQILAILAAHRGRPTSTSSLIAGLWPQKLPQNPQRALRVVLSRLRNALGPAAGVLQVEDDGVILHADTDLAAFGALLDDAERATTEERLDLLEQSLKLWRGQPLGEVEEASFAEQLVSTLVERRSRAVTALATGYLEVGQPGAAISVARPAHLAEPHRDQLAAVLARAYALDGQKAEALQTIEVARAATDGRLLPEVAAAEQDILAGAIEFDQPQAVVAREPVATLIGRTDHIEALCVPTIGATVVVGEPGIGKSAVLDRAADLLESRGSIVYRAEASPNPERPLEPIATLLQQLVRELPSLRSDARFDAVLARLIPETQPASHPAASLNREELLAVATEVIMEAATLGPLVIVIDNCHLLDRSSAAVVESLVGNEVRVLAGSRQTGATHLDFLLRDDDPLVAVLALPPLTVEEVGVFVADMLPASQAPAAGELHARTGGNPLFLHLLSGLLGTAEDGPAPPLPSSVLVAVQARLEALSQHTIATLQWASALGPNFSPAVLRELCGTADDDLARAEAEGLVELIDDDSARFCHTVVMEATYQLISDVQKIAFHDEIGHLLEDLGSAPAEYAIHCGRAATFDPIRAVRAHIDAAAAFAGAFAWDLVDRHLGFARRHHESHIAHLVELDAELTMWQGIQQHATDHPEARLTLQRAARMARRSGATTVFVTSVLELADTGLATQNGAVDAPLDELLDEALELDLEPSLRAELCATASALLMPAGHADRARQLYAEAERIARERSDAALEASVLVRSHFGLSHPDDARRRPDAAKRLTALAGVDPELRWEAAFLGYGVGIWSADVDLVDESLATLRAVTPRLVRRQYHFRLAFCESSHSMLRGEFDRAEAQLGPVLEHGLVIYPESRVMTVYGGQLLAIRQRQGRAPELRPLLDRLEETRPGLATWIAVNAHLAAETGDEAAAARSLAHLRADGFAHLVRDLTWTGVVSLLVRPIAAVGTAADAQVLHDQLLPHAGRMTWTGNTTFGPVDLALAELARLSGDLVLADRHEQRGADTLAGLGVHDQWLA